MKQSCLNMGVRKSMFNVRFNKPLLIGAVHDGTAWRSSSYYNQPYFNT